MFACCYILCSSSESSENSIEACMQYDEVYSALTQFDVIGEEPSTHSVDMKADPAEVSLIFI